MIVWKDKFVTVTTGTAVEPRYFGMFTDEGNNAWDTVYQNLQDLAKSDPTKYGEAMDTVVREMVYDACQFTSDFYI